MSKKTLILVSTIAVLLAVSTLIAVFPESFGFPPEIMTVLDRVILSLVIDVTGGFILFLLLKRLEKPIETPERMRVLQEQKLEHEEKERLRRQMSDYQACRSDVERVNECIKRNIFQAITFSYDRLSSKVKKKIAEYSKEYSVLDRSYEHSKSFVQLHMTEKIRALLPKTLEKHDLVSILQKDVFVNRIVDGERLTKSWIEDCHPEEHNKIMANIKGAEKKCLIILFRDLDDIFRGDMQLERFKEERKKLIEFGLEIINDLKDELKSLEKEHSKYNRVRSKTR